MQVTPVTPELLVAEITELVAARSGRVRLAVDGPPPTNPRALADAVAVELRARGRATIVVDAADYLRPASLRLECCLDLALPLAAFQAIAVAVHLQNMDMVGEPIEQSSRETL